MDEEQWQKGLAGVRELAADEGMLFIFERAAVREFWMRGCLISLDVAFIDADGRVAGIHTMPAVREGEELRTYSSVVPVVFALEVPAGELRNAGVGVGSVARFSQEIQDAIKGAGRP
jgi:hypothetical protein